MEFLKLLAKIKKERELSKEPTLYLNSLTSKNSFFRLVCRKTKITKKSQRNGLVIVKFCPTLVRFFEKVIEKQK